MYLNINEFRARDFCGSNALWNYVVINAPMEDLHNPPRLIGIFTPKSQGKKGIITINNIHNVVNGKMTEFNHRSVFMDPMPCGFTWLLIPCRGLT
jgi:hypothetical protein